MSASNNGAGVDVDVDTTDAEQILQKCEVEIPKILEQVLKDAADEIVSEARSNLQTNTSIISATLHASIRILEESADGILVGTDIDYSWYVEYGRASVKPVTAKFLHFFTKDGKEVFTKYVGPAEPRPFFEPAVIKVIENLKERFNAYVTLALGP